MVYLVCLLLFIWRSSLVFKSTNIKPYPFTLNSQDFRVTEWQIALFENGGRA